MDKKIIQKGSKYFIDAEKHQSLTISIPPIIFEFLSATLVDVE